MQDAFYIDVARGMIPGVAYTHRYGRHTALSDTIEPISHNGNYATPTVLTSLEALSTNAADTTGGLGGTEITIKGIGVGWLEVSEVVSMNGVSAVALSNQYYRIFDVYVSKSGMYATKSASSHGGDIIIRESGGGTEWARIIVDSGVGLGQTQIAAYTVPMGKRAFLLNTERSPEYSKQADIYFFHRSNADSVSAPYEGTMRLIEQKVGVSGFYPSNYSIPRGPFIGPCDIGFMARRNLSILTTIDISIDFELIIFEE